MSAAELFRAGRLTDAVAAAIEDVRRHPADTARRGFLCQLLWFAGDWERAEKQLAAISQQDPEKMPAVVLFRQLLRCELARREVFVEGRVPEFFQQPGDVLQLHLRALVAMREGQPGEAVRLVDEADETRGAVRGNCNGRPFEDLRDIDDRTASFFEVFATNGSYYWVAFSQIRRLEFEEPAQPHDLVWRPARMSLHDDVQTNVYLPVLYPLTASSDDDQLRLGRSTQWTGGDGTQPGCGAGQRMLLVDEEQVPLLSIMTLEFEQVEES